MHYKKSTLSKHLKFVESQQVPKYYKIEIFIQKYLFKFTCILSRAI